MSSQESDPNDPEIQRNGFEVIFEDNGVDPRAAKDFFDEWFDPEATWDENVSHLRAYAAQANQMVGQLTEDDIAAFEDG